MLTKREKIIYLAALLEGEGHFGIISGRGLNHQSTTVVVELQMTDEDIVQWAAELIQNLISVTVEARLVPKRMNRPNKPIYKLSLANKKATELMRLILPFMGLRRSAKINQAINAYETRVTLLEGARQREARKKRCLATQDLFQ